MSDHMPIGTTRQRHVQWVEGEMSSGSRSGILRTTRPPVITQFHRRFDRNSSAFCASKIHSLVLLTSAEFNKRLGRALNTHEISHMTRRRNKARYGTAHNAEQRHPSFAIDGEWVSPPNHLVLSFPSRELCCNFLFLTA